MSVVAGSADVLGTGAPEGGSRPSRTLVAAGCVIAVLAAAVLALLQRQAPTAPPPVDVAGSMRFSDISSRMSQPGPTDEQHRDGFAVGRIELRLPDRELEGDARLEFGASVERVGDQPEVIHAWGSVRLRFDAEVCDGWFGWSNLLEPLDGGGAMHVRCEDGEAITARLVATDQPTTSGLVIDLADGEYSEAA